MVFLMRAINDFIGVEEYIFSNKVRRVKAKGRELNI